jgi:predicted alpha/beta-fold hydrolase
VEIGEWILVGVLMVVTIVFFAKYVKTATFYYSIMDFEQVTTRQVWVPVGDVELHGVLLLPKYVGSESGTKKLPLIISINGWGESAEMVLMMQYSAAFAMAGPYAVLNVSSRGFGKSPGKKRQLIQQIWDDVPRIIDFGAQLPEVDPNRLGYFGISMGGQIGLSRMYKDPRIKAIVAQCSPFNMKANFGRKPESLGAKLFLKFLVMLGVKAANISEEFNRSVSPEYVIDPKRGDLNKRVFLIHAKDDNLVAFSEFEKIRAALDSPDNQVLMLEHGGHMGTRQEMLTTAEALRFFGTRL